MGWVALLIVDKQVLVPLTSSLYVPGTLGDVSHVVVDIGTGYYVKKVSGASSWCECGLCEELGSGVWGRRWEVKRQQQLTADPRGSQGALLWQVGLCAEEPRDIAKDHREETGERAECCAGTADEAAGGAGAGTGAEGMRVGRAMYPACTIPIHLQCSGGATEGVRELCSESYDQLGQTARHSQRL